MDKLTAEQWQNQLDTDFPHGLIMSWTDAEWTYTVPYITVVGMEGDNPDLVWDVYGIDKGFHYVLASYTVVQEDPHLMVRVTFEGEPRKMLWNSQLSPHMAALMDKERAERSGA